MFRIRLTGTNRFISCSHVGRFQIPAPEPAAEPVVDKSADDDLDPLDAFMSSLYDEDAPEKPVEQIALANGIGSVAGESSSRTVQPSVPFVSETDSGVSVRR